VSAESGEHSPPSRAVKVPEITASFWVLKILTTGAGEAASDYLVHTIDPVIAALIGLGVFSIAMAIQFAVKKYVAWIYWFAVAMVAVFGTMAADALHIEFHVPYFASSAFYFCGLVVVFVAWYVFEKTLSIHSIFTVRREAFYWCAVLATFAMGTAVGDLAAYTIGIGYLAAGLIFLAIFALPGAAYWGLRLNAVLAFWFAYIMTRPLSASFADWLGVPRELRGLNLGRGNVALVGFGLIAILVAATAYRPHRPARSHLESADA
jgi:uncharacterized membrane-anchored protein